MASEEFKQNLLIIFSLSLKVVTSLAIIPMNKYIYVHYGFPNMTLTCLHFIMTFIGIMICYALGFFQIKRIPIKDMIPMSISFCGFVVLANLSLQFNTVGIYQTLKVLTMPFVMIISMLFYNEKYSLRVKLSTVIDNFLN